MSDLDSRILKAKIQLMNKSAFIATIALSATHTITSQISTAAVDGMNAYYNPEFIEPLPISQLTGLMAHECWHIAFQHMYRRMGRDPMDWNAAADHVINLMLRENGFELPPGGLWDSQFVGMGTEEVYEILHKDPDKFNKSGMMLDIQGNPLPSSTPKTKEAVQDEIKQVQSVLVKAQLQAEISGDKTVGNMPGELARLLTELTEPKVTWEDYLWQFMNNKVKCHYDYSKRNRYRKYFMPKRSNYGLSHLTWAIDSSGSVTPEEFTEFLCEIQSVRDVYNPEKMTILDCDTKINNIYEIDQSTDILSLEFTGGGGTRFQPVLDYVKEHPTDALIYFTDLYGERTLDPVDYPILWICNSKHAPANIGETVYIK